MFPPQPIQPENPQTLIKTVQQAMLPERREPGPGDVGPTTPMQQGVQLVTLKMEPEEVADWWKRINASDERLKKRMEVADILLDEYMPIVKKSGEAETVKSNRHFRNVHTKLGQLFYRTPDLILTPDDPGPSTNQMPNPMQAMMPAGIPLPPITLEDTIAVKQQVLKKKMGRDGIKAGRLMDELIFDTTAWAGFGCCKVGYTCVQKPIQRPVMGPDPNFQPPPVTSMFGPGGLGQAPQAPQVPQVDPLTGQPQMETIPVTIYRNWYARRFSPKKLVANTDLFSTRFDEDGTFIGMHFYMSPRRAMRELKLTEDEANKLAKDDKRHDYKDDPSQEDVGLVHGVELWVKLSYFTDELHPLAIGQLILVEGIEDRPVVWRPSPDQTFDPATGQLTQDSLEGFPVKVLTIRDLADSAFPLADSAFTNSGIKQMGTWRRQSVKMRDVNIGKFLYDVGAFDDPEIQSIKDAEAGDFVGVAEGKLAAGPDKILTVTPQLKTGADDFRAQDLMSKETDETIGISPNQAGGEQNQVISATEVATIQQGIVSRNDKEQARVIDLYLDIARAVDQLLMRYASQDEYVMITGDAGAQRMMVWSGKRISGKYLYEIAPDSQLRADSNRDFQLALNFYNLAAADPLFNRAYVLKRLARMRGWDPMKVVNNEMQIATQPPHGGQQKADAVNQHEAGKSGGPQNAPGSVNHRDEQAGHPTQSPAGGAGRAMGPIGPGGPPKV